MDDHSLWVSAYGADLRRRIVATAAVVGLAVVTGLSLMIAVERWNGRFEHVFHPLPGLSYAAPPLKDGVPVIRIDQPLTYQRLAPNDAYRFNASVPVSTEPLPAAAPFRLPEMDAASRARAIDCLTAAIYYEAASESALGQAAVAQVVLNRVRHPAFPNTVCGVVYSGSERRTGCQFTFTCDGARARAPEPGAWLRARRVALAALGGAVTPEVGNATHYHTLWVAPYWSPSLVKVANIGAHTFYRWKGFTGGPAAFNRPHAGIEPAIPAWTGRAPLPEAEDDAAAAVADPAPLPPAEPVVLLAAPVAAPAPATPAPVRPSPAPPSEPVAAPQSAPPPPPPPAAERPARRPRLAAPGY